MRHTTINNATKDRGVMNKDVYCLIYSEGLPFNLVKSLFFQKALESIGKYGRDNQPPTYNEARVTYLHDEIERIDKVDLEKYKEWSWTGCTLMSDD